MANAHNAPRDMTTQEPVAEVVWWDPRTDPLKPKAGKIIDASLAFMDGAELGTKLYAAPPTHLATIAEMKNALEWLPIETAPMKIDILVGVLLDGVWKCAVYCIRDGFWREDWDEEPTHWVPLPAAPVVEG